MPVTSTLGKWRTENPRPSLAALRGQGQPGLETLSQREKGGREGKERSFQGVLIIHLLSSFPLLIATLKVFGKDEPEITQNVLNPEGFYPCRKEGVTCKKTFGSWYQNHGKLLNFPLHGRVRDSRSSSRQS